MLFAFINATTRLGVQDTTPLPTLPSPPSVFKVGLFRWEEMPWIAFIFNINRCVLISALKVDHLHGKEVKERVGVWELDHSVQRFPFPALLMGVETSSLGNKQNNQQQPTTTLTSQNGGRA